jgi:transcriptional regulator with PAS, ATPase and Fis domain
LKALDDLLPILESIVSFIDEGVIIAEPDGAVIYHNPSAYQLLGLPANQPITNLNRIADLNFKKSMVRAAIEAGNADAAGKLGSAFVRFTEKIRFHGQTRYINFHTGLVEVDDHHRKVRLVIMHDQTEMVQLDSVLASGGTEIKTRDPHMLSILTQLRQIAPTEAFVLLQGASGTGKTRLARLIHQHSQRANAAFVEVNCAAIPDSLIESELFGHIRGAFTGATQSRPGRFQSADRGTLFLDEISEIPLHLQAKLLKVLQEQAFEMVGSDKTTRVNIRVIAASNRNLRQLVEDDRFRADLYYRLAVIPLDLPSLHERPGDIPLLIDHFLEKLAARGYPSELTYSQDAVRMMLDYPWPGNVRELENAVEHGVICAQDGIITPDSLPMDIRRHFLDERNSSQSPTEEQQRALIVKVLQQAEGNRSLAAELLGIDRTTLWRRMQKFGIK